MDIVKQFNLAGDRKTLLKKALTTATDSGGALVPQKLEKVITNTAVRLSPEIAMIEPEYDAQLNHEFNRLKALPKAGGAMGESADTRETSSQFERDTVRMKVVRRKGKVTNFLQDTSANLLDAVATEFESHLTAHVFDLVHYIVDGDKNLKDPNNASCDYEFDGLDKLIESNRIDYSGSVPSDLDFLDEVIDRNITKQGANHKKAFLMSPQMLSRVSKLLTNVRLNQGLSGSGITQVDVDGGWRLNAYRDIPIITSGNMRNKAVMPNPVSVTSASGGALPDTTQYFIKVAFIGLDGESQACAEQSVTTGSTTNQNKIVIDLTGIIPADAIKYVVYLGTTTGAGNQTKHSLHTAFEYDANGSINGYVSSIEIKNVAPNVPVAQQGDLPLEGTFSSPEERVIFWDMDKYQGLGKFPYTNRGGDKFNGLITMKRLAETDDYIPFLVKTYGALCPSFEATSAIIRKIKSK